MAKRVAVVLAGCGVYDGSEIHEASAVLVHLSRGGASVSRPRSSDVQVLLSQKTTLELSVQASRGRTMLIVKAMHADSFVPDDRFTL